MHKLLLALLLLSTHAFAQTTTDNWFTDLESAQTFAQQNDGEILIVFSGSDWCKPCIKFKKDILLAPTFVDYAKNKVAILYLDFPTRKKNRLSKEATKYNESMAEKYNKQGAFPKIVLMDKNGTVLSHPQFKEQSPADFIAEIQPSKSNQ